jgi:hypothetical protein
VILLTGLLTLVSIVRTPSFQQLAGRLAANYLTGRFHTEVFLEKLRISDLLYIELHGLRINDNHRKEMIRVDDLRVKINRLSLKKHIIEFERINLDSAGLFIKKYPNDSVTNLNYFLQGFKSDTVVTSDTTVTWSLFCNELSVNDLTFGYRIGKPDSLSEGIDYNDLLFSKLFLNLKDIAIIGDSLSASIKHISGTEQSGIELLDLSCEAQVTSTGIRAKKALINTGKSSIDLDLDFLYKNYDELSEFLDSVRINSVIRSSVVTLSDVGYFAPELFKMTDPVMVSGVIEGPISNYSATDLVISLGDFTEFEGDISMKGLPYILLLSSLISEN